MMLIHPYKAHFTLRLEVTLQVSQHPQPSFLISQASTHV